MDSTQVLHGQKQMSPAPCDGAAHMNGLNDDLLLHILRFLPEARDVARTSAVSRRWRDISTRAPVLLFSVYQGNFSAYQRGNSIVKTKRKKNKKMKKQQEKEDCHKPYNDFIHNVLARRVKCDAYIDTLELDAGHWPGDSQADVWLRHAMQLVVGSLKFHVRVPLHKPLLGGRFQKPKSRVQLPHSTMAKTMSVELDYAILLIPPTVDFHALTDLTLSTIKFIEGDDARLGTLLSSPSCCPRLRKLTLRSMLGLSELQLNCSAMEILDLDQLYVRRLVVDAPRLSALNLGFHFMMYSTRNHTGLTVRAPALETLNSSLQLDSCRFGLQNHMIQLLQECRPNVHQHIYLPDEERLSEKDVEVGITQIPQLPGFTNMTIQFNSETGRHVKAIATGLLERCCNLRYLHLDVHMDGQSEKVYNTDGHCGSWKHDAISLKHLHEVKFSGFSGQAYCFHMVQLLLVSAPTLERMLLTTQATEEGSRRPTVDLASLKSNLPRATGKWTARPTANGVALEWRPDSSMLVIGDGDA